MDLAITATTIATIGTIILFNAILLDKQAIITPQSEVIYPDPSAWVNIFQTISGVVSFALIWAGPFYFCVITYKE